MKTLQTIFFFLILSVHLYSQEKTIVSGGIGFPIIIDPYSFPALSYKISGINLSIEKPLNFFQDKPIFCSVRPGVDFTKFYEDFSSSGMGYWYEYEKYFWATSLYSKFLVGSTLKQENNFMIYGGTVFGVYFWSDIKELRKGRLISYENGESFFNSTYYGFLIGIQPDFPKTLFVPKLELSYFPNYVTMIAKNRNAVKISILVNFNLWEKG